MPGWKTWEFPTHHPPSRSPNSLPRKTWDNQRIVRDLCNMQHAYMQKSCNSASNWWFWTFCGVLIWWTRKICCHPKTKNPFYAEKNGTNESSRGSTWVPQAAAAGLTLTTRSCGRNWILAGLEKNLQRVGSTERTPKKTWVSIPDRIHVWYIHLHLVDFYGKCR